MALYINLTFVQKLNLFNTKPFNISLLPFVCLIVFFQREFFVGPWCIEIVRVLRQVSPREFFEITHAHWLGHIKIFCLEVMLINTCHKSGRQLHSSCKLQLYTVKNNSYKRHTNMKACVSVPWVTQLVPEGTSCIPYCSVLKPQAALALASLKICNARCRFGSSDQKICSIYRWIWDLSFLNFNKL